MKIKHLLLFGSLMLSLMSCDKLTSLLEGDDEEDVPSNFDYGKWIDTPNGSNYAEIRTSNSGVYLSGANYNNIVVSRCDASLASPSWINFEPNDIQSFTIANPYNEASNTFSIFYTTASKHGYKSINTSSPSTLLSDSPQSLTSASAVTSLTKDNSPQAYIWAIDGRYVRIKGANQQWTTLKEFDSSIINYEVDRKDAILWATTAKKLYKINAGGSYTTFDLAPYYNSSFSNLFNSKIRFSENKIFLNYQNKILMIEGNSIKEFYKDASYSDNTKSIEFTCDPTFVYISNGIKKHISLLDEIRFVPDIYTTTTQEVLEKLIAVKSGLMEASNSATDQNVYVLAQGRLLVIPKSL